MYVDNKLYPEHLRKFFININDFPSTLNKFETNRATYVAMKKHIIGCVVEHKITGQTCIIQSVIYASGFSGLGGWYSRYNSYFHILTTNGSNICVNDLIFFDDEMNQLTYSQYTDKFWPPKQLTASF